jgi:hypothetical protein
MHGMLFLYNPLFGRWIIFDSLQLDGLVRYAYLNFLSDLIHVFLFKTFHLNCRNDLIACLLLLSV